MNCLLSSSAPPGVSGVLCGALHHSSLTSSGQAAKLHREYITQIHFANAIQLKQTKNKAMK